MTYVFSSELMLCCSRLAYIIGCAVFHDNMFFCSLHRTILQPMEGLLRWLPLCKWRNMYSPDFWLFLRLLRCVDMCPEVNIVFSGQCACFSVEVQSTYILIFHLCFLPVIILFQCNFSICLSSLRKHSTSL